MEQIFRRFLLALEEPGRAVKIAIASFIFPFPVLNFLSLDYLVSIARNSLSTEEFSLPELERFPSFPPLGGRVFLLIIVLFFPAIVSCFLGAFFFLLVVKQGVAGYLGYSLVTVFFFLMAVLLAGLTFLVLPVCFFRFVEGDELSWSIKPIGVWEDLSEMGASYWQSLLFLFLIFSAGEFLFLIIAVVLNFLPFGHVIGALFFLFFSSFFCFCLLVVGIMSIAPLFRHLHYHYK